MHLRIIININLAHDQTCLIKEESLGLMNLFWEELEDIGRDLAEIVEKVKLKEPLQSEVENEEVSMFLVDTPPILTSFEEFGDILIPLVQGQLEQLSIQEA